MKISSTIKKIKVLFNRKQKVLGCVVLFFSMIGAVLETVGVSAIIPFADVLLNPEKAYMGDKYFFLIRLFHLKSGTELIVCLAISVAIVYIIKNLYFIFLSWIRARYAGKIERELSVKVLENYMYRGYIFFTNTNTGTLLRSIQHDVTNTYLFLYNTIKLLTDLMVIGFIIVYIVIVDWQLAVGVGAMSIIFFGVIASAFSKINMKAGEDSRYYLAKSNQVLLQSLEGVKEVLVLKKEKFFIKEYKNYFAKHVHVNSNKVVFSEIPAYVIEGISVSIIFIIICLRVLSVGVTDSLLPTLASFVVAAFRILPSLGKLTSEYSTLNYCNAGLNAVYQTFNELLILRREEVHDKEDNSLEFGRTLELRNLVFSYGDKKILDNLSMKINKGESVAFIGPSGSGKTTLSDLILGLLKPSSGEIMVDDRNIAMMPYSWSKMIGYVSQTMYLADETIRFNVAFGEDECHIDDERVWECLRKAHVDDYVKSLDETIYTVVGDRGVKFSGGQRQRIAIARALYHNPQILVLDEATSALDNETENEVMESIDELQGEVTLIIVAHRMSTVKKCDRIYNIVNGVAVEKDKSTMNFA